MYEYRVEDSDGKWKINIQVYSDQGLVRCLEFNEEELKINDTMKKVSSAICSPEIYDGVEDYDIADNVEAWLECKRSVIDKFAELVQKNAHSDILYCVVRSMELFYEGEVEQCGEGEATVVKGICEVLEKYKRQAEV